MAGQAGRGGRHGSAQRRRAGDGLHARPSTSTASPAPSTATRGCGWSRIPTIPLLNRAIQSQYAPGSVFKMVVAAAGLQEGTLTPMDRVYCNGEFHVGHVDLQGLEGGRPRPRGPASGDRRSRATSSSTSPGSRSARAAIARYARAFGLGAPTGHRSAAARSPGWSRTPTAARAGGRRALARRRDREHVDRPGRAAGDADAGRAHDGGRRQRRRALEAAARPARRARRTARRRGATRAGDRPRRAVAGGVGVPAPDACGRSSTTAAPARRRGIPGLDDRGQDRHRADHRQAQVARRGRTTPGSRPSRPATTPEVVVVVSSSAAARAGRSPRPSRARSTKAIFLEKVACRWTRVCDGLGVIVGIDRRLLQNVDWLLLGAALGPDRASSASRSGASRRPGGRRRGRAPARRGSASASWPWSWWPASTTGSLVRAAPALYLLGLGAARSPSSCSGAPCRARAAGSTSARFTVQPSELFKIMLRAHAGLGAHLAVGPAASGTVGPDR